MKKESENNTTTIPLKIQPIVSSKEELNEIKKFIRDSQYAQYQGLNLLMGELASAYYKANKQKSSDIYKETKKGITNSNQLLKDIEFGEGIDTQSMITQKVKKDFEVCTKNGLAKGERSVTNYKRTFPLMTRGRNLNFHYESESSSNVIIDWVGRGKNKKKFKVVLGRRNNENIINIRHTLNKIITGEYKAGQSLIKFDKENNLILLLNVQMPKTENKNKIIEGRVCGVDLGINIPAFCSLNDNPYIRQALGSKEDFLRVRQQMQNRRNKLQKDLNMTKGGKGRKKKLQALDRLKESEKNFVRTYSHTLSRKVVEFAKKNQCEYIHLEKSTKDGFDKDKKLLRNWSYYQLQTYIKDKAEKQGIKVRFINPSHTSQKCYRCGYIDKENRKSQSEFICKACGLKLNADHNAAINIANSDEFIN